MNKEIWKDIPNYEGLYKVNNLGDVYSTQRINNKNYSDSQKLRWEK